MRCKMGFCDREKQLMTEGVTCIDNRFILNYVPDAHGKCVAVYLLGPAQHFDVDAAFPHHLFVCRGQGIDYSLAIG